MFSLEPRPSTCVQVCSSKYKYLTFQQQQLRGSKRKSVRTHCDLLYNKCQCTASSSVYCDLLYSKCKCTATSSVNCDLLYSGCKPVNPRNICPANPRPRTRGQRIKHVQQDRGCYGHEQRARWRLHATMRRGSTLRASQSQGSTLAATCEVFVARVRTDPVCTCIGTQAGRPPTLPWRAEKWHA